MKLQSLIDSKNYFVDTIDIDTQKTPDDLVLIDSLAPPMFVYQVPSKFKWSGKKWEYEGTLTDEKEYCNKIGLMHLSERAQNPLSKETAVLYDAMDEMFNMLVDTMDMNTMLLMKVEALEADKESK